MLSSDGERPGLYAASVIVKETTVTQYQMWLLPSPARHGGCKKDATPAPLALSGQGEGSELLEMTSTSRESQTRRRQNGCRKTSNRIANKSALTTP
jgi:hypothetical protein